MYQYLYNRIQKIILKKSLNSDSAKLAELLRVKAIIDIGCANSEILKYLKNPNKIKYFGYEPENFFILKSKKKYNKKNLYFSSKKINEINFSLFDKKNTLILAIGIFHHIKDTEVVKFVKKVKGFKVFTLDAVRLPNQSLITKLLYFLDKGKYIRFKHHYKNITKSFKYKILKNRYLRFKYDHLCCYQNINSKIINKLINSNK